MGQINTNNYPTVSSLADADLLIVENAINGTGTTTPKQLRENAIGTDPLETTAQTVTGAINELKDEIDSGTSFTLAGAGYEKNYSSGVVDTDVYLHRAPKIGDRFLIRFVSTYTSPPSIKVYDEEGGTAYTLSFGQWSSTSTLSGICLLEVVDFLGDLALDFIYNFNGKEYQSGNGISISGTTIRNTAMQMGDNAAYVEVDEPITSGNLGFGNGDARYLFVNFDVDVTPNDTTHLYYMFLTSGLAMGLAVLKDRDGNGFSKNLYAGMMLFCKRESGGSGTEGNPYILTVVSVFDWSVSDDGAIKAGGNVLDGNGNDLASVAALEQSASGNPIIVNAQGIDAKELSVVVNPIQPLHGYDHPWAGGAEKNKLPFDLASIKANNTGGTWEGNSYTYRGVTYTFNDDGSFYVDGTASANAMLLYVADKQNWLDGTYTLSDGYGQTANFWTYLYDITATQDIANLNNPTFTISGDNHISFRMFASNGKTFNHILIKPMIRVSTDSADWQPWENICPISGRSSVTVNDHGKNLFDEDYSETADIVYRSIYVGDGTFTMSTDAPLNTGGGANLFFLAGQVTSGASTNTNGVYQSTSRTVIAVDGYVTVAYRNANNVNPANYHTQIEVGNVATAYVPYVSPTNATIQLGQTVYGARINFKTGEGIVDRVAKIFTGDEGWSEATAYYALAFSDTAFGLDIPKANMSSGITCNMLVGSSSNGVWTGSSALAVNKNGLPTFANLAAFKTWLSSNPLQVCYELATPIIIQLTPSMLKLLEGYNYITADGEMQLVYIPESVLPAPPTTDGTYRLICTVANGVPSFSWVSDT